MKLLIFAAGHNYCWFGSAFFLQTCDIAMVTTFAPSLANLFMAHWEQEVINTDPPPRQLSFWRRYVDDVLLWDGDLPSLETFFSRLNQNDRGITLQYEASHSQIHFLDLNIVVKDGRLDYKYILQGD